MDWVDRPNNYKGLYGILQLLQGSHLDNRDLKHRQRNGTTTTGVSKIFPREGSAHVRCCENVVQPSSTTESQQIFVLVKM